MTAPFAGLDVRTFKDLMACAPAFLVERLLAREDAWSRTSVEELCARNWHLPLVRGTSAHSAVSRRLPPGRAPLEMSIPPPRVWCLCVRADPWADDGKTRFGTVQWMRAESSRPVNQSDFERSCTAGVSAALAWLQSKMPLGRLPQEWRFVPTGLLGYSSHDPDPEGGSAGLAAALSVVACLLETAGLELPQHIAASGIVAPDGKVGRVEWLAEKLNGIVREAPFVEQVFIACGNEADVPDDLALEIIPVRRVAEALDRVWGQADFGRFQATHSPDKAALEAAGLELAQRHEQATALAEQVLQALEGKEEISRKVRLATIRALAVRAINFTHRGATDTARRDFDRIEELLEHQEPSRAPFSVPIDLRALYVAARASHQLDDLEVDEAIRACTELTARLQDLSPGAAMLLMGSLLRCQTAAGLLEEAETSWEIYSDLVEEPEDKPRMWCYRVELLVKRAIGGDAGALQEARAALQSGHAANAEVLSGDQKGQNLQFLRLAECRICAAAGDAVRAVELAGPPPSVASQAWPEYHLHRFAGEALAKAGRLKEALGRLEAARRHVDPKAGPFLRLVLLTAGAREAVLRIEHGRAGWEKPAGEFSGVYEAYKPGRIEWPRGGRQGVGARRKMGADGAPCIGEDRRMVKRWAQCLQQALDNIPY